MIKINRKILAQVLKQIRRCLSLPRNSMLAVNISTTEDSTAIRATMDDASLVCIMPRGGKPESVCVPLHALCSIKHSGNHDVEFNQQADRACIRFHEAGHVTQALVASPAPVASPPQADWLTSNDRSLGSTLFDAARCTDGDATRYSLGFLRLRGTDGQVAATDGRQAFTASGFTFPNGELLVPAAPLGRLGSLRRCSSISVGRSSDWFTLQAAVSPNCWRLDLRLKTDARFPNVDQCMPSLQASWTELNIDNADADFLLGRMGKQPLFGTTPEIGCITLDLEKSPSRKRVYLRARVTDGVAAVIAEIELARSTFAGCSMRVTFDPQHLLNALQLGFRTFHLQSTSTMPVFCHEGQRSFVWTALHDSLAILPTSTQRHMSSLEKSVFA